MNISKESPISFASSRKTVDGHNTWNVISGPNSLDSDTEKERRFRQGISMLSDIELVGVIRYTEGMINKSKWFSESQNAYRISPDEHIRIADEAAQASELKTVAVAVARQKILNCPSGHLLLQAMVGKQAKKESRAFGTMLRDKRQS